LRCKIQHPGIRRVSIQTEPSQHSRKNCLGRFSIARPNGQIPPQNNGMTSSSACPIRGSPSLRFHDRHQHHMGQASLFRLATLANEMPPALFYPCLRPGACHVQACLGSSCSSTIAEQVLCHECFFTLLLVGREWPPPTPSVDTPLFVPDTSRGLDPWECIPGCRPCQTPVWLDCWLALL
jgi:hypothetical protein